MLFGRTNGKALDWSGLGALVKRYPGQAPVQIDLARDEFVCRLQFGPDFMVAPCPEFWRDFENWKQA